MKKIVTILLVMVLVLGLAAPALAAEGDKNDSITVNNAKTGETYSIYKMFDLSVDSEEDPAAYSYTINADWEAFFTGTGAGAQYITVNDEGYVTAVSDAEALAKAAAAWAGKPTATDSKTAAGDTVEFTGLADGYWLVTSTLGTFAMIETTPDKAAVSVNEKNPEDTVTKQVKEDSTGAFGDSNDAQIGDTVEFKSTVKIVKGTRNVMVHDKMTSGLTYTAGSVAIAGLTKGTEYTVNESPADGDTFDITFSQTWIDGLDFGTDGYKEYEITYTATLNENAVASKAITDQTNTTKVTFGDSTESEEDTTTTTTHKFSVFKHAQGKTTNLAGAEFSLKKAGTVVKLVKIDDTNYRVANGNENGAVETFTTVETGDIVIWGVDADDDYTLEEINPPKGYNKLKDEVEVTVGASNDTRIDVENRAGTELPSTGGRGVIALYVIGGILVVGAAALLITRKRMEG